MTEEGQRPDRRRTPRYAARIKVRFRSVDELVTAYTADVSRGGLFVTSAQQLPPGTEVQLSLELPDDGAPALVPAKVRYVVDAEQARAEGRQAGMGVAFAPDTAGALAERIARVLDADVEDQPPAPDAATEPFHVLVVDDSASYRAAVQEALRAAGHRVTVAEHGLAALGLAMKSPPDLVLSDVTMPVMDGWKLLRQLRGREATATVPVVFLTTLDSERDRIRGYELGVDDYIAKPFVAAELLVRVERVVVRARREGPAGGEGSGMRGDLRQVSLPSLLAFAEAERRSGTLEVRGPAGRARVVLKGGRIAEVELPEPRPPGALLERALVLLDWAEGRFALVEASRRDEAPPPDAVSIQAALLEHARRADEAG
ncbi:MAG TPA: response regulator [Sandaracinaceae bacterium LLY-WYZ-13_1]|nr:response regulator [Sandaracinaceae bacterium LLY-WYZ-13_1]